MVLHTEGEIKTDDVLQQGAQEDIRSYEGRGNRVIEKIT